jgi:hypothetical protein
MGGFHGPISTLYIARVILNFCVDRRDAWPLSGEWIVNGGESEILVYGDAVEPVAELEA